MSRPVRIDDKGPQPSTVEERPTKERKPVATASDEDVRKAMKRITRDHEALIKALAK